MKLLIHTVLPDAELEDGLTNWQNVTNEKLKGKVFCKWEKTPEGYVMNIEGTGVGLIKNFLRAAAEHSLREKDPTGTITILKEQEENKNVESDKEKKKGWKFW